MFLEVFNRMFIRVHILYKLSPLERRFRAGQIISIAYYVVISSVGIKRLTALMCIQNCIKISYMVEDL